LDFAGNGTSEALQQEVSSNSHESVGLGLLFASKSFFQILVAPFVGGLTDKYDLKSAFFFSPSLSEF
jgi:hypothetical protein